MTPEEAAALLKRMIDEGKLDFVDKTEPGNGKDRPLAAPGRTATRFGGQKTWRYKPESKRGG